MGDQPALQPQPTSQGAISVEADFYADWAELLRRALGRLGYSIGAGESAESVCRQYFNVLKRRIELRPREVLRSQGFTCPPQFTTALDGIETKARAGEDLNPYQSKGIREADVLDRLLNDWGIHHLHLGSSTDSSGFVERTGPLLFTRIDPDRLFMIAVMAHGAWSSQSLMEILHNNWPDSIKRFRMKGVLGLERRCSDSEIGTLRAAGVQTLIELTDGTIYFPIGGGIMLSGDSAEVIETCDLYAKRVRDLESDLRERAVEVAAAIGKTGAAVGDRLKFRLCIDGDRFSAIEELSGYIVRLQ